MKEQLSDTLRNRLAFTDMCFDSSEFDQQQRAQRLIVSTNSHLLFVFDLNFIGMKSKHSVPHIFSTGDIKTVGGISCLAYVERKKYLLCGTINGQLIVVDGMKIRKDSKTYAHQNGLVRILQKSTIVRTYNAFQNKVTSIGLQNDQVVLTGYSDLQMHKNAYQQQQDEILKQLQGLRLRLIITQTHKYKYLT